MRTQSFIALLLGCLIIFGCFPRLLTGKIVPVAEQIVQRQKAVAGAAPASAVSGPVVSAATTPTHR